MPLSGGLQLCVLDCYSKLCLMVCCRRFHLPVSVILSGRLGKDMALKDYISERILGINFLNEYNERL